MANFFNSFVKQAVAVSFGVAMLGGVGPARAATCSTLYSFKGGNDAATPEAGLINVGGTLYGTSQGGGKNSAGTVFSLTTSGVEKVVYAFGHSTKDGAGPVAGLLNVGGTLYGTTEASVGAGYGTVFRVTAAGAEKVVYSFQDTANGEYPEGALIKVGGTLYGTTLRGGKNDYGTVFSVTKAGVEKVLYSFKGNPADGAYPQAALVDVGGTLYGTTSGGGASDEGIVFSVTTDGTEKVLHSFNEAKHDGSTPYAGLLNVSGTMYGTTFVGGTSGVGTVFSVTTAGAEKVIYSFKGGSDGDAPAAGLINDGGTLYGTTGQGGSGGVGTVFGVTTAGAEKVLCSFSGVAGPVAGLLDVGGTLYGTTVIGGANIDGSVFFVTP